MYAVIMVRQAVAVQPRTEDDRGRQCRGAAVAAMGQRGKGGSAQAVMANPAVTEKRSACTAELVVVQRRDDRDRGVAAGVQDRRRDQGKDVVDVDDVRRELGQGLSDRASGVPAPQHAGRQRGTSQRRPRGDFLAAPLEEHDLVAARGEGGRLLVDDGVLAAGCRRPIAIVDDEDLHCRPLPIGAASSDAATMSSSR